MGEREDNIATKPQPRGGTTPASWRREATSMEMNPGALPRPGRVPTQEFCPPQNLFSMAAEIGIASGEKGSGIRVSSVGLKIGAKGGPERGPKAVRRAGG